MEERRSNRHLSVLSSIVQEYFFYQFSTPRVAPKDSFGAAQPLE